MQRQEAVRFLYGFTGSAASTILFSLKLYKLKNCKSVDRRHVVDGIAQSPYGHRTEAVLSKMAVAPRSPHFFRSRTGFVPLPSGGCGDCTATPLRLHDFRTISAQPLYGLLQLAPAGPYKKSHNARRQCEHIRRNPEPPTIPKNKRTENRRQIYRTAPGANVN